jgi:hypothetical protein
MYYSIRVTILYLTVSFWSCNTPKTNYTCGNDPTFLPKKGMKNSVNFIETARMDTTTAVVEGYIHSLLYDEPLVFANIILRNDSTSYGAQSNLDGQFKFKHIVSGSYQLIAKSIDHRELIQDSILIGEGSINKLEIQLGFKGRDE